MYNISPAGKAEGVLNDYDLASWDKFPTTNSDRTGTVPFMALDLLHGGLDQQIPRLYRHDAESFVWVLAYLTAIAIEYKGHSVKISRPPYFNLWFKDDLQPNYTSKLALYINYGRAFRIPGYHAQYLTTVRKLINHWVELDNSLFDMKAAGSTEPETDDPKGILEGLIKLVGADSQKGFAKVQALLLEAVEVPGVV